MNSIHVWFGASGIVSNNLTSSSNLISPSLNLMRPGRRLSCPAEKNVKLAFIESFFYFI